MKISAIEAIPVRLPREREKAVRTAGSPTALIDGAGDYRWSAVFPALYAVHFETALVKVTLDSGLIGWGEAQAPLAPEVACAIVDRLLEPVLKGAEFDGSIARIDVVGDPGHGLGPAAVKAIREFRFAPGIPSNFQQKPLNKSAYKTRWTSTPEMVRKETWTCLLAYNMIRQTMLQAALASLTACCPFRSDASGQVA